MFPIANRASRRRKAALNRRQSKPTDAPFECAMCEEQPEYLQLITTTDRAGRQVSAVLLCSDCLAEMKASRPDFFTTMHEGTATR